VGDQDNGVTGARKSAHHPQKRLALLRCQDGRGLIQYQDAGLPIQQLENFDTLLLTDGELPHVTVGVYT
jgi:hypothetical protein